MVFFASVDVSALLTFELHMVHTNKATNNDNATYLRVFLFIENPPF